jgi:hypothetical protein
MAREEAIRAVKQRGLERVVEIKQESSDARRSGVIASDDELHRGMILSFCKGRLVTVQE